MKMINYHAMKLNIAFILIVNKCETNNYNLYFK